MARRRALFIIVGLLVVAALLGGVLLEIGAPACGFEYTVLSENDVNFDVVLTPDCESQYGIAPFAYTWDFGDGGMPVETTNPHILHVYSVPGLYLVHLTITDSRPAPTFATQQQVDTRPGIPMEVGFDVFADGLAVKFTPIVYGGLPPFTYAWEFGDGSTASTEMSSHTYAANGTYSVKLTVRDGTRHQASASKDVVVKASPPPEKALVASFKWSSSNLVASFDASASGGRAPYVFQWAFGDGEGVGIEDTSHTYKADGSYIVKLTVTDAAGTITTIADKVDVKQGVVNSGATTPPSLLLPPLEINPVAIVLLGAGLGAIIGGAVRKGRLRLVGVPVGVVLVVVALLVFFHVIPGL